MIKSNAKLPIWWKNRSKYRDSSALYISFIFEPLNLKLKSFNTFSYFLFGYHKWLLPNCHFYLVTKMVITNLSLQNCLFYLVIKLSLPKKSLLNGSCQIAVTNNPSVNISANEVFTLLHLTIWSIWFSKKKEGKKDKLLYLPLENN